ncbi:iron-sulfur cluster loop [Nitrospira sp. T9]|uniref:iron-sulfur cluster loop n=1 Tax=unclassified Nitrospira TaxID=2652172 RepID=UPI003F9972A7
MNSEIADVLRQHGEALFQAKAGHVAFTKDHDADALLNDLANYPHAFVLACIMGRQIKAERAWLILHLISVKLGGFSLSVLYPLSLDQVRELLSKPEPLHRFPGEMSYSFHAAIERIACAYAGDAARIWHDKPSSAEVVLRFLRFRGIGPKIATMAANILARDFKIPLADHYPVDVSADVHVRRVFTRLGLVGENAGLEEIIYCARALHPAFPGLLDFPVWEIGRKWCRPTNPHCVDCYMHGVCPTGKLTIAGTG